MELSELDRLAESVKLALDKIERLQSERGRLHEEKRDLENRLKKYLDTSAKPAVPPPPPISHDRLNDIRIRLNSLIEKINDLEHRL
jgi:chromosome segregation ATPase